MFNVSGGGKGKAGMMEEKSASAVVPQVPTDSSGAAVAGTAGTTQVVDLIQPHSVSAEEVAGFYGCTMGQVRLGDIDAFHGGTLSVQEILLW